MLQGLYFYHALISMLCLTLKVSSKIQPFNIEDTKNNFYWRRSDVEKCEPFETYVVDCNRCICGADGVPYCSKMACIDMNMVLKRRKKKTTSSTTANYDINYVDPQIQHY